MMIDRISETLENFPHIDTYVIVARDGDFRQISRVIRKRRKHVVVFTDPSTANTTLLENKHCQPARGSINIVNALFPFLKYV